MKAQSSLLIAAGVCTLLLAGPVYSDKLCLKVSFNKLKEKVSTKSTVAATCPSGYKELIDTESFKGTKGDKGDAGEAGIIDVDSCVTETAIASGAGPEGEVCSLAAYCGAPGTLHGSRLGDILIGWAYNIDNYAGYLVSSFYIYPPGKTYPTGVQITTTSEQGFGSHVAGIKIICCLPS